MSDNLDDFLRQAAERRAKRQQQKSSGHPSASGTHSGRPEPSPPRTTGIPQASSQPSAPARGTRQVFQSPTTPANQPPKPSPKPPAPTPRLSDVRPTVGHLEPSLSDRHVESNLQYADERMETHLKEAFTSEIRSPEGIRMLRQSEPAPGSTGPRPEQNLITSGDLKVQLRNPQTLRLAILAQEVLKRPYS